MAPALGLDPLVIALVLLAAVLHASWNAVLKVAADRITTSAVMNLTGLAVGGLLALFVAAPASASWAFILLSVAIHFAYFVFLLGSYRYGDLSQVYPLARGVAPLIVAFVSPWLIGEHLGRVQLAGVMLLCLGILSLTFNRLRLRDLVEWKPVSMALATGGCIAAYTVVDGLGVRVSGSPAGYIAWLFMLDGVSMTAVAAILRGRSLGGAVRSIWKPAVLGGLVAMLAYGIVIWCYSLGAIAPTAALRETSVVIAAGIGTILLREPFGRWRIAAASFCAFGIVAINLPVR
ncbi:MAG TPA: DMT family transporter [Stellaceae bacterium]|nr:DMT family transporter [Stellaceae bacterium]